jgi:GR25 family glycosyltransferase involved in LPS biosynthesis
MKTLNDYFDKLYCINLDKRTDRWQLVEPEFKKHGLDVERVPGYDGSKLNLEFPPEIREGAVGCSLSHLFTIKLAKQNKLNNFLLLEDDVVFEDGVNEKFFSVLDQVPDDWDMLYLGGQHFHGMNMTQVNENVYKCVYTLAAQSVGIRNTVYDYFIDKLMDITKINDLHYAESHKEINAYVIIPHLSWQRNTYSDIEKTYVDYSFLKNHRYPEWGRP